MWLGSGRVGPITHVGSDLQQNWINLSQYVTAEPASLEHFKSYLAQTKKHAKRFIALTSHPQLPLGLSGSYKSIKTQITIGSYTELVLKHAHVRQ